MESTDAATTKKDVIEANSISTISPYRHNGMWVFDDKSKGLDKEPFVSGADTMIDRLVSAIPDAAAGFTMIFSAGPFPGYQADLVWQRQECGGNWYHCPQFDMEGWLCPALLKYFDEPPHEIYVQAKPSSGGE